MLISYLPDAVTALWNISLSLSLFFSIDDCLCMCVAVRQLTLSAKWRYARDLTTSLLIESGSVRATSFLMPTYLPSLLAWKSMTTMVLPSLRLLELSRWSYIQLCMFLSLRLFYYQLPLLYFILSSLQGKQFYSYWTLWLYQFGSVHIFSVIIGFLRPGLKVFA